jgi:transposase
MDAIVQTVLPNRTRRRYRPAAERRRIVEETMASGLSVAMIARSHGINANQLFHWRKLYHAGLLGKAEAVPAGQPGPSEARMLPVSVVEDHCCAETGVAGSTPSIADAKAIEREAAGSIEVSVSKAQVRISGRVDGDALRAVLECLLR